MATIYLLRHAEKDGDGNLTEAGKRDAEELGKKLSNITNVICSSSERSYLTAKLVSGQEPVTDKRADYATAPKDKSDAINEIAAQEGILFSEAAKLYGDKEVLDNISAYADQLSSLINELLDKTDSTTLIVAHDLCIAPAMEKRGLPFKPLAFLSGYILKSDGTTEAFNPN